MSEMFPASKEYVEHLKEWEGKEMSQNLFTYRIQTSGKQSLTNIDVYLEDAMTKSGVKDGILVVFCPHTTAAITINDQRERGSGCAEGHELGLYGHVSE